MKKMLLLATIFISGTCLAQGVSETVTEGNSSLKVTIDPAIYNLPGTASNPVQLLRTLEWTVDGRRILVYPSSPSNTLDIGHFHGNLHVAAPQLHAQGPLLGFGTGTEAGTVTGGVVYTVDGGAPGSGASRISEKVDILNKTSTPLTLSLAGMGYKSPQPALEVPDYSGLVVSGTTVVFTQGRTGATSITDRTAGAFAPVTVLPVVTFQGFNPLLNQNFTIPGGGTLTMITELTVTRALLSFSFDRRLFLIPFNRAP
jgi:hypothetical protein